MRRIIATFAASALLAATPAAAYDHHHRGHHHDDVDAGDVIGGAVLVGGIAALISAIGSGNQQKQDQAVDTCAHEAEARMGGRLAGIGKVAKNKGYYTVEGTIADANGAPLDGFSCTIRNGTIYGFRSTANEA